MNPAKNNLIVEILRRNSHPLEPIPTGLEPSLKRLYGVASVVFDIYGTLFISGSGDIGVDTSSSKVEAFVESAEACGLEWQGSPEEKIRQFHEFIRRSHQGSMAADIEFPEVDILEIWTEVWRECESEEQKISQFAVEFESRANPVWPMPELEPVLAEVSRNCPMGIISNAQFFTLELFECFLGRNRQSLGFDEGLEVFSFATGHAKPGQRIFEIAVEKLTKKGIHPENVLYVGNDMLNDIVGAQTAGFQTCLFAGDQRSLRLREGDARVQGVVPDIIVNHLPQIIECLG